MESNKKQDLNETKACSHCKEIKPLAKYAHNTKASRTHVDAMCNKCRYENKKCNTCGVLMNKKANFRFDQNRKKYYSKCHDCTRASQRKHYHSNTNEIRRPVTFDNENYLLCMSLFKAGSLADIRNY